MGRTAQYIHKYLVRIIQQIRKIYKALEIESHTVKEMPERTGRANSTESERTHLTVREGQGQKFKTDIFYHGF